MKLTNRRVIFSTNKSSRFALKKKRSATLKWLIESTLRWLAESKEKRSGSDADAKLIGMDCRYRPAFSGQIKNTKVINVRHMVSVTGGKTTILALEDGSEIEASNCYFPFSAMDSDKD